MKVNLTRIINSFRKKISLLIGKGVAECQATYYGAKVKAKVEIYSNNKKFREAVTPCLLGLRPQIYRVVVTFMSEKLERDIKIEARKAHVVDFRLPGGMLKCSASYAGEEVPALVEIYEKSTGELIATRITPFEIGLEAGEYILRVSYTPTKEEGK